MGTKQLSGKPSKYDAICAQLCRDLKAKGVILIVNEGRLGTGMSVAATPDNALMGHPQVLAQYLRGLAATMDEGGVGPEGVGIDTPEPEN